MKRLLFVVSEDWYFVSHRLHLAKNAIKYGYSVALLSHFTGYQELIESSGIELIEWSLHRKSYNLPLEAKAILGVFRAIRHFKPDIVHSVAIKPVLYTALACRMVGVDSRVFALGGLGYIYSSDKIVVRFFRPFFVLAFKMALAGKRSRLILQNKDDETALLSSGVIDLDRIRLVRGAGVDTALFAYSSIPSGEPLIVLPARLLWSKGVGVFVDCARKLINQGRNVRFALVGEPDQHNPESVPVNQIEEWAKEGVIEWWGRQNDMPKVYQQSSIVCLPTTYGEGLPKSLLEAASCGRPIVTYDVPGCREIVTDGVNGYLVGSNDADELLVAINKLLNDAALSERLGKTGREIVLKEFSQQKVAQETLAVWEEVL